MTKILASKPNKISAKTSTSENLRFTKPSLSKLSNVIQELELSSDQVHELSLVMQHIEEDLDFAIGVIEKLPPRSTLTRRLKNLEKIIRNLKDELKRAEKDLDHFLPHDLGSFIGKAMSLTAINHGLGQNMFPRHVDLAISTSFVNGQPIDQRQIEKLQEPKREALGLQHSGILLTYLINGIYEPLRLWVELDRLNKGGRTPNMRRRYIIYWLAYYSPEILGRPATTSITGSFMRLCEAIFLACEFHIDGLEKVIPAIIDQAHTDRKNRDEAESDQIARLQNLFPKP